MHVSQAGASTTELNHPQNPVISDTIILYWLRLPSTQKNRLDIMLTKNPSKIPLCIVHLCSLFLRHVITVKHSACRTYYSGLLPTPPRPGAQCPTSENLGPSCTYAIKSFPSCHYPTSPLTALQQLLPPRTLSSLSLALLGNLQTTGR